MRPLNFGRTQTLMVKMPREYHEAMLARSEAEGIAIAEQIRRAIGAYLEGLPKLSKAAGTKITRARAGGISLAPKHAQEER
jgi:hypothetical protein